MRALRKPPRCEEDGPWGTKPQAGVVFGRPRLRGSPETVDPREMHGVNEGASPERVVVAGKRGGAAPGDRRRSIAASARDTGVATTRWGAASARETEVATTKSTVG